MTISTHLALLYRDQWNVISKSGTLETNYMAVNANNLNWHYVSQYQSMTEDIITQFIKYVDWSKISIYQILSENFIRTNKKMVNYLINKIFSCSKINQNFKCHLTE